VQFVVRKNTFAPCLTRGLGSIGEGDTLDLGAVRGEFALDTRPISLRPHHLQHDDAAPVDSVMHTKAGLDPVSVLCEDLLDAKGALLAVGKVDEDDFVVVHARRVEESDGVLLSQSRVVSTSEFQLSYL